MFSYINDTLTTENATFHGVVGPEMSDQAEVIAYISGQKLSTILVLIYTTVSLATVDLATFGACQSVLIREMANISGVNLT